MNINLDNYESFFLMYVDKELSAPERKYVEEFLVEYPYLQAELEQLKETVLPQEKTAFAFKDGLLKTVLSEDSLQENLLLYLDKELEGPEKQQLEDTLMTDARLQEEWALLKKTKLNSGEVIVFEDKDSLYRHEAGRLVVGRFIKWAVAAAVLAGGFFIGIDLLNKQADTPTETAGIETNSTGPVKVEKSQADFTTASTAAPKTEKEDLKIKENDLSQGKLKENSVADNNGMKQKQTLTNKNGNTPGVKQPDLAANNSQKQPKEYPVTGAGKTPETTRPVSRNQDLPRIDKPAMSEAGKSTGILAAQRKPGVLSDTDIQPLENLFAQNTSLDAEEDYNDNHIFMMDEEKVSRTKAAGFFKKIKRTVERTTKIKTGNSLKIAGFEFAVK